MALLLDERPVVVQPSLVRRFGIMEAAILQQLHYWTPKATAYHDGRPYVYKTYAEWSEEIGVTAKAVRGALDRLRKAGVVEGMQNPTDPRDRTLWWRIEYTAVDETGSPSAPEGSPGAPEGSLTDPAGTSRAGDGRQAESTTEMTTGEPSPEGQLFAFWKAECKHPQARFTADRRAKVRARLREGYTSRQIETAIKGAALRPTIGDNGQVYDDLELICRSGSKLEGFIARVDLPANVAPIRGGRSVAGDMTRGFARLAGHPA